MKASLKKHRIIAKGTNRSSTRKGRINPFSSVIDPILKRHEQSHPFEGEIALIMDFCEDYFKAKRKMDRIAIVKSIGCIARDFHF